MKKKKGKGFQYQEWCNIFESLTFKSSVITLPWSFIQYLEEDGIFATQDDKSFPSFQQVESSSEDEKWENEGEVNRQDRFLQLKESIDKAIKEMGGVFPKLNWSAPQDVMWMIPDGTLCCHNADQVVLLLKSSDIILHDLEQYPTTDHRTTLTDHTSPFVLVLKKYHDLSVSYEFRCFVKDRNLIGISQRYITQFFPFLLKERTSLKGLLTDFFHEHVNKKFPESDYVFDVHVMPNKEVNIIDFAIFGEETSACLFTWEELFEISRRNSAENGGEIILRVIESNTGIQPNQSIVSRVPYDLRDFSDEGALKEYFQQINLDTLKQEQKN